MGRVTVVNLTDSSIQSAIVQAGTIHRGINGMLPHVYYHYDALELDHHIWVKWYIPGFTEDFPKSDLAKIGWYIGGAIVTALGLVAAVLSVGAATPVITSAWGTFTAAIGAIESTVGPLTAAEVAGG